MTMTVPSRRARSALALLAAASALSGCIAVGHSVMRPEGAPVRVAGAKVLVIEPEVRLWVLDVVGVRQPQAAWTAAGLQHVRVAVADELRVRGAEPVSYAASGDASRIRAHDQLVKLHRVVFGVALVQQDAQFRLATKANGPDWTLGDAVQGLHEEYGADYAMFVGFDDSYQGAGVVGSALITAVTLGVVAPPPGRQNGAASLVDLRTGDLVWMRNFSRQGGGDLRQLPPARAAVQTLLKDLPR
jgi:hypothetical protein